MDLSFNKPASNPSLRAFREFGHLKERGQDLKDTPPKGGLQVKSETLYVSVGASRHTDGLNYFKGYLIYSQSKCLFFYDLINRITRTTLRGHSSEVSGHTLVVSDYDLAASTPPPSGYCEVPRENIPESSSRNKQCFLMSIAKDNCAIVWRIDLDSNDQVLSNEFIFRLTSPSNDVFTTVCAFKFKDQLVSITPSIGGFIYLWVDEDLMQTIDTEPYYCCLQSKLYIFPINNGSEFIRLLFLAGDDHLIRIFQIINDDENGFRMEQIMELSGHTDWIRCLDILDIPSGSEVEKDEGEREFLLASAGHDSFVRIWHMEIIDHDFDLTMIRTKDSKLSNSNLRLTATLETVLTGHSGMIYGLCFFKKHLQEKDEIQFATCSSDKTVMVWRANLLPVECKRETNLDNTEGRTGTWSVKHTMGETGETNLALLGLCLSEDEKTIYAQSFRGAIHGWKMVDEEQWDLVPAIMGHYGPVTDLAWERTGAYLLSCSLDKTCRLHALAACDNRWHELARPQVHGHEINCLASINFSSFVTGAEEKVIRAFETTQFFLKNFKALAKQHLPPEIEEKLDDFPAHAQLPALGLSIRGSEYPYDIDEVKRDSTGADDLLQKKSWYKVSSMVENLTKIDHLDGLPPEEILLQYTLWWETNKLFRHANEIQTVAVDSKGIYMASASKARTKDSAYITVWNAASNFFWPVQIDHHSLSVTRLKFSPNDKYLLSVGRDRLWSISEKKETLSSKAYEKILGSSKSNTIHDRIIWDCCWTYDSKYFMTTSRDKRLILWPMVEFEDLVKKPEFDPNQDQGDSIHYSTLREFEKPVRAIDSPAYETFSETSYLFAFGFEDGSLELWSLAIQHSCHTHWYWESLKSIANFHTRSINRLAFNPYVNIEDTEQEAKNSRMVSLASCGDDCIVQITKFVFTAMSRP